MTVTPYREVLGQNAKMTVWLLMGAAAFVLVIACANVANLTLMRGVRREHELVVRAALGAGVARLRKLLLVENMLLALLKGEEHQLVFTWPRKGDSGEGHTVKFNLGDEKDGKRPLAAINFERSARMVADAFGLVCDSETDGATEAADATGAADAAGGGGDLTACAISASRIRIS